MQPTLALLLLVRAHDTLTQETRSTGPLAAPPARCMDLRACTPPCRQQGCSLAPWQATLSHTATRQGLQVKARAQRVCMALQANHASKPNPWLARAATTIGRAPLQGCLAAGRLQNCLSGRQAQSHRDMPWHPGLLCSTTTNQQQQAKARPCHKPGPPNRKRH